MQPNQPQLTPALTPDEKALVDKYIPLVKSYANKACYKFHKVPPRCLDDLTGFLLVELCHLAHRYDPSLTKAPFGQYLVWNLKYKVVKFCRGSGLRLRVPTTLVNHPLPNMPARSVTPVLRKTITSLLHNSKLTPKEQETITLYYLHNKTQQQVAHDLNLSTQAVSTRLQRALTKIQEYTARNHLQYDTFLLPPGLEDNTYDDDDPDDS